MFDRSVFRPILRRFFISMPFTMLLGICVGILVARHTGGGISIALIVIIAAVVVTFIAAMMHAFALTFLHTPPETPQGELIGMGCDVVIGAATGRALAPLLDLSSMEAIGAGSAFLFLQGFIIEKLVIQNVLGDIIASVIMPSGTPHKRGYSRAAAHAARGEYDQSRAEYERHIKESPKDPAPLFALSRMEREQAHQYARAAHALERALAIHGISTIDEANATRELCELWLYRLHKKDKAVALLLNYSNRHRDKPDARWATLWLNGLKGQAAPVIEGRAEPPSSLR